MKRWGLIFSVVLTCLTSSVFANQQNWNQWLAEVRREALAEGIRPAVFDSAFAGVHEPSRKVKRAQVKPERYLRALRRQAREIIHILFLV